MKVVDQILLLKEWNKLLSVTLKRGEWIETWTASAWLFCCEGVAEGFTKDVYKKRSSPYGPWMSLNRAHCYLCPASLCLSSLPAPCYQMCLKGHYKKKKRASGITVGSTHHAYYKKSLNKCETKYRLLSLQPSSHHYFHSRSVMCWFPSACVNIF